MRKNLLQSLLLHCVALLLATTGIVLGQQGKLASPNQAVSDQVKQATSAMQAMMTSATDITTTLAEAFNTDADSSAALIGDTNANAAGAGNADPTTLTSLERDAIAVKQTTETFVDLTQNINTVMRLPRLTIDRRAFPSTADLPPLLQREGAGFVRHIEKRLGLAGRFTLQQEAGRLLITGTLDSEDQVELVRSMARMTPGFEAMRLELAVAESKPRQPIPLPRSRWERAPLPPRGTAPKTE